MSGHSKWSNIHRKKEANDKVRSGIFTKMAAAISVAVRKGGGVGDPDQNFALRLAVDRARAVNMPKDNIDRAIAKGMGKGTVEELSELVIEGFAPGGVAFMVEVVTNNRNRSVAELRLLIEKHGGRMGEMGSVGYLFNRVGIINFEGNVSDEQELELIDLGMIDLQLDPEGNVIYTEPDSLHKIVQKLSQQGSLGVTGRLGYRGVGSESTSPVETLNTFIELLEEHPDVQEVYVNLA